MRREDLKTDLAREVYDWSPLRKEETPVEIFDEIVRSFCSREERSLLISEQRGQAGAYVAVSGEHSLDLHARWLDAWYAHGYYPPILVCTDDH